MKDDSGSYAVFTEQGSSASQMTAAKIMDIISILPGCDGQAADAASAYTFLTGLLWEMQLEKMLLKHGWEKVSEWDCFFVHRQKRMILICVCG